MKYDNIKNYHRGWVIGDFTPSIFKEKDFEICITDHKKDEETQPHYHTSSTEINIILEGECVVNKRNLSKDDIFIYEKNDVSDVIFIQDTRLAVIRIPSAPNDKIIVDNK